MARLVFIKNPFDPIASREIIDVSKSITIQNAINEHLHLKENHGFDLTVAINGNITKDLSRSLTVFDSVSFCLTPHDGGGGDGGKNIISMVAMIAVVVLAPYAVGAMFPSLLTETGGLTMGGAFLSAGLMVAGGMLVNAIFPSNLPKFDFPKFGMDAFKDSPTYGWDSQSNPTVEGGILPVLYGTTRITPPIISKFISLSGDNQYLNILYAIAGHEIDSVSDIEINNQDSALYKDVTLSTRLGTNDQTAVSGFADVRSDVGVNAEIIFGATITRQTEGNSVSGLVVGLQFPIGMFQANLNGSIDASVVNVKVRYRLASGGTWTEQIHTISYSTKSVKRHVINLASGLPPDQYEIEVSFSELPVVGQYNTTFFEYFQEIVTGDNFSYPNTAILAVKALATNQLSGGLPKVTCLASRNTFLDGNSANNPSWVSADLLSNTQYAGGIGAGRLVDSYFQEWADYCDDEGYQCNIYFDSASNIRQALNTVGALGFANVLQAGNKFLPIVDKPDEAVQRFLFTVGNILYNSYEESYLPQSQRANVAEVFYYDKELDYARTPLEVYQHNFDTTETEVKKISVNLVGQVSRTNAIRHGKRLLNNNRYLTLTSSWMADIDSLACIIGDVVDVQHDVPQYGFGGRIVQAIDTTHIEIDREVTMTAGVRYHFTFKNNLDERETVEALNTENTTNTITLLTALTKDMEKYNMYSFGVIDSETKAMRITNITRQSDQLRKVTALEYQPEVYFDTAQVPIYTESALVSVKDLQLKEVWNKSADGSGTSLISGSWLGQALFWDVYYKKLDADVWIENGRVYEPKTLISGDFSKNQTYVVAVVSRETPDDGVNKNITLLGSDILPADIENFQAWQQGEKIAFRWDHIGNIEGRGYEIRRGVEWDSGQIVVNRVQENEASWNPPADGTYRFMIKAVNNQLQYSETEAVSTITVDITSLLNFVVSRDEIPTYIIDAQEVFNLLPIGSPIVLKWIPSLTDTELGSLTDTDDYITDYKGDSEEGRYITEEFDLGSVVDILGIRMDATYSTNIDTTMITDVSIATRTDLTYPNDTDLKITSESTYRPYFRHSEIPSPVGSWQLWVSVADFSARYVAFKWETLIDIPVTQFEFSSLPLSIDTKAQEKTLYNESIANTGTTFTLSAIDFSYILEYSVSPTVLGNNSYYATVGIQSTQFIVYVFNESGTGVNATVNLEVKGV